MTTDTNGRVMKVTNLDLDNLKGENLPVGIDIDVSECQVVKKVKQLYLDE
jgi:hypothetical protein